MGKIIQNGVIYTGTGSGGGSGASSVDQLTDVQLTTPTTGDELVYNSSLTSPYKWENKKLTWTGTQAQYDLIATPDPDVTYFITDSDAGNYGLNDLANVNITSAANGQLLTYDATNSIWVNADTKADRVPKPAEYSSSSTYAGGDFCTHSGSIYCCTYPISSSESWNSDHWALCIPQQDYLHSINPKGYGSFSLNRKMNTIIGPYSSTEGYDATASGYTSHAEGAGTVASGGSSHAEGYSTTASELYAHAEGYFTTASGRSSHSEGHWTTASGYYSHTEGQYTTANHKSQHVFGEYNIADPSSETSYNRGNYIEIVGNGTSSARSNARTLDWSGNEVLAGGLKINSTQDVATQVSLTQAQYDALVSGGTVDLVNTIYFITDADAVAGSAAEITYSNTTSGLTATNVQGAIDEVAEEKADRVPEPAEYDSTATYNLGDFVTYNGNIYMCIAAIETREVWISAHWRLVDADQSCLHSLNPKGAGSFSLNRKDNTTVGFCSFAEGYNTTASGGDSHAEGSNTTASGNFSHSEGLSTTANHRSQHTFGEYNVADASTATASNRGNYVEIVGNGTGPSARSNARTLDWSGNEVLAGTLTASGLVLTGSITDATLTCPRCPITINTSKCYQIGNIIFYSAKFAFGDTVYETTGGLYFFLNKVTINDFCWGEMFYDTGDLIYKVSKGASTNMWVTSGTTRYMPNDAKGKSNVFLNLVVVKA